jgi:hypothetical protein
MIKNNSERIAAREARKEDRFARKEDKLSFKDEKKNIRAIGKAAGMNGISRLGMRMATKAADNMVKVEGNPEGIVGKAVNFANKVLPQAGQALVKAVAEGGGTFDELISAGKDALKLTDIEKKDSETLVNTVVKADEDLDERMKWAGDQSEYGSPGNMEARANAQIEEKNITDGVVAEGDVNIPEAEKIAETPLPGSGGTASNVMNAGGKKTTFDAGMTVYDAKKDIAKLALNSPEEISNLALENLNVQDYYPNVNKDIAVGTYSGKYLGSSTIYAAPGAIIPLGLYNERKKALAKAATEKQAAVDKLLATPETSAQYQVQYNEAFFKGLEPFLTNAKDLNSLSSDPEFLKYMANMQGKAREITQSVAFASDMVKAATDDTKYVPKEMQQTAQDVLYNQINNLDAVLSGDANANSPFKDAQVYINMRPQVDALAKDLLNPDRMGQSPINLKTGGEFDTEAWNKDRSAFFNKVRSGIGYEEYASGIRKYFTGDYESLIDNLIASQPGSNEAQAESLKKYFAAQIQQQDILKYDNLQTDEIAAGQLALAKKKWDYKVEQDNFWGNLNQETTTAKNIQTGMSFNDEMANLSKKGLTGKALNAEIERLNKFYGVGQTTYDPVNKTWKSTVEALPAQVKMATTPTDPDGEQFLIKTWGANGEYDAYVDFKDLPKYKNFKMNGISYKAGGANYQALMKQIDQGGKSGVYKKSIGTEVMKGYVGENGKTYYLNDSNYESYNKSPNKITFAVPVTALFVKVPVEVNGPAGEESETEYTDQQIGGNSYGRYYDIAAKDAQQTMNNTTGYTTKDAATSIREEE